MTDGDAGGGRMALVVIVAVAGWVCCGSLHDSQHADSLLVVLVSTQHWTPFYWGQDRYGMLVPLLAMPFRHPAFNMVAQSFLATSAALAAPFLVARFATAKATVWFSAGALTNILLLFIASRDVQFDWLVLQPYGLSISLGAAGLLVLDETRSFPRQIAAFVLIVLAHWVQSSVVVVLIPALLLRGRSAIRGLLFTAGAAMLERIFATSLALPRTPGGITPVAEWPHAWAQLFRTSEGVVAHTEGVALLLLVTVGAVSYLVYTRQREPLMLSSGVAGVAITHWLVVGTSEWVRMNLYYPRYVFPSLMLFGVAAALLIVQALRWRPSMVMATSAVALLTTSMLTYGPPSWHRMNDSLDSRFGRMTPDIVASQTRVIGGDYWTVWPAVFHANLALHRLSRPAAVFGLTYRSAAPDRLWQGSERPVIVAARPGDPSINMSAEALGFELRLLEHRPLVDLFVATKAR